MPHPKRVLTSLGLKNLLARFSDRSFSLRSLPDSQLFNYHSISTRLFLHVLGGALVGLGSMSLFFYWVLEQRAIEDIQNTLNTQVELVDRELQESKAHVTGLAAAVKTTQSLKIQDPEAYKQLVFEFFKKRPSLSMAVFFGQLESQIVTDRPWFYPYFYVDQGVPGAVGQRLPAPYENVRYSEIYADDNYPDRDYWKNALAAQGKDVWLEPYDWSGITMTSFYTPIYNQANRLIGLAGSDFNVTALTEKVSQTVTWNKGYFAVLSQEGNLLAYPPDPEKARTRASYQQIPDLSTAWSKMQNQQGVVRSKGILWAYRPIPSTQWVMVAAVPETVILNRVLVITLVGTLGAGAVLALVVILFGRRLNQQLKPILDECHRLIETEAQRSLYGQTVTAPVSFNIHEASNLQGMDELEVLAWSFHQMSQQLQASLGALEHANEDLEQRVEQRTAELKHAKERADAANRAKSDFLTAMSHELRTPLNAILGMSQILQENILGDLNEPQREAIATIENSGEHLLSLISGILDLAKIEAGKLELNMVPVEVQKLCQSCLALIIPQALIKQIRLQTYIPEGLPKIVLDKDYIHKVLTNLLGNAVKFTPKDGTITFRVRLETELVIVEAEAESQNSLATTPIATAPTELLVFEVEDTGIGIAPTDIEKIFQPFVQGDSRLNRSYEGAGLGLALVKRITTLHQGRVFVSSEVGKGSCFTVKLPYHKLEEEIGKAHQPALASVDSFVAQTSPVRSILPQEDNSSLEAELAGAQPGITSVLLANPVLPEPPLILVVDDNETNLKLVFDYLRLKGYRLIVARNGVEALAEATAQEPDLIVIDIQMPEMDGVKAMDRIRANPTLAEIPIIALTALAMPGDREKCIEAGANEYLVKPVRLQELNQIIQKLLKVKG